MSASTTAETDRTPPGIRPRGPYWGSLDGLRGVTMLGVFVFHIWPPAIPGASICVDSFFVLSAFLITVLLIREHQRSGRIRLGRFYLRRVLRLLPVLFVVVPLGALVAWLWLPGMRADVVPSLRSTLLYYANFRAAAHPTHMAVFLPTWSLSTEEQFYLVWPTLLVVMLLAGLRGRALIAVSGTLFVASTIWLQVSYERGTALSALYYRPDLRVTGILVGTTLGLLFAYDKLPSARRIRRPLAVVAVLSLGYVLAFLFHPQFVPLRFQATWAIAVACLAWAVIILQQVTAPLRALNVVLDNPAARWVGRASYTIYLVHVPVIRGMREAMHHPGPVKVGLVSAVLTLAITAVIHYAIERPALRLKDRRSEPPDAYAAPARKPRIPAWTSSSRRAVIDE